MIRQEFWEDCMCRILEQHSVEKFVTQPWERQSICRVEEEVGTGAQAAYRCCGPVPAKKEFS
jgi:hypothetical protein